jgi:hypothetical protein
MTQTQLRAQAKTLLTTLADIRDLTDAWWFLPIDAESHHHLTLLRTLVTQATQQAHSLKLQIALLEHQ